MQLKKHSFATHSSVYEIAFFDVDPMNIMWHGHYVKYLELARCAFLEEIGYTYDVMREKGYSWPIVQLNIKYVQPSLFRQKIEIELMVREYETCLRIDYIIRDQATGKKLTTANTMQVAVSLETGEMQMQTPECWRQALQNYVDFRPLADFQALVEDK